MLRAFIEDNGSAEYDKSMQKLECRSEIMCSCKPSILVVDDDPFNLQIEEYLLENELKKHMSEVTVKKILHTAIDGDIAVDLI